MSTTETTPDAAARERPRASAMMEALWWVLQRAKNKAVYNVTWRAACARPLDLDALGVAWQAVVDRHEALRGSLHQEGRSVLLDVVDHVDVAIEHVTIDDPGSAPVGALLDAIAEENHERSFTMSVAPPARLTVVTVGDRHELLVGFHHSMLDGWGIQVLIGELSSAYADACAGRAPAFDAEPVSLREHVAREHADVAAGRWDDALAHWRGVLDGAVTTTLVPDHRRFTGTGAPGEMIRFALSKEANLGVAALSRQYFATPFVVFLSALQTVLARGGDSRDVCTGVVTANRTSPADLALVGYVANMMFARTVVRDDDSLGSIVERTRDEMWATLAHQSAPFPLVFGALTDESQAMLREAIPVILNYLGPIGADLQLGDVGLRLLRSPNRASRTDISVGVIEQDGGFLFESEYDTGRFDRATAQRLFHDIDTLLALGGADPARLVSTIPVRTRSGPAHEQHRMPAVERVTPKDAAPETAALATVRRAWAEVLGTEAADADEDFFAVGGRSLKVVQLTTALEAAAGAPFDVVGWLAEPTPRRAAEQLAAAGDDAADLDVTLVEVRDGDGPHVHLVPGAGGGPQDYLELIAGLPDDWRVTASQERAPLDTIAEMAQRFRADLDAAGLRPDVLVGWSMGGQIAFELAARYGDDERAADDDPPLDGGVAAATTERLPCLAVLDSTPSIGYAFDASTEQQVFDGFVSTMAAGLGAELDGTPTVTSAGSTDLALTVLAARLSVVSGQPVSAGMLRAQWSTFHRHAHAVRTHVARLPVASPTLLVAADLLDSQLDQWDGLFTDAPRRLRVDTDHYGVLQPPVAAEVAAAVTELRAAVASRS